VLGELNLTNFTNESYSELSRRPSTPSNVDSKLLNHIATSGETATNGTNGTHHCALPQFQSQLWTNVDQLHIPNNNNQSVQTVNQVNLTQSLMSLVQTIHEDRKRTGCSRIRSHERRSGHYYCTLRCGRQFNSSCELFRHENLTYMQELWFCTRCGDSKNATKEHLFVRCDKFREHLKKDIRIGLPLED
jgi:hypothetical protein